MGLNSSRPYGFLLIFVVSFSLSGYWALCFLVGVILPLPLKGGRLARVDFYRRREDRNSLEWRA